MTSPPSSVTSPPYPWTVPGPSRPSCTTVCSSSPCPTSRAMRSPALAGVMDDKNAAKGVLVTTSWVGKASRDFAARNGSRIEIIEGRHLKSLLRQHLGLDALIGLPKLPPGWERH